MANDTVPSTEAVQQAAALFEEIAASTLSIDRLCSTFCDSTFDGVALQSALTVIQTLVARMGWMSDLGCKKLNGMENARGDAEQWMVNNSYVELIND